MNKKQQRELENKIREAMEEPADLTEDEIADIRNRAYSAYQKKMADEKQPSKSRKKKSGFLRRVVAVFAIAVGLIVMSVVYSVLAPVTVGNANSFVRRAVIWVNDQLHLGISFPVPNEEGPQVTRNKQNDFSSIEEAAEVLDIPIIYICSEEKLKLTKIENVSLDENSPIVSIHYRIGEKDITITIEQLDDGDVYSIISDDAKLLSSPIGDIILWETNEICRATMIYQGYSVEIFGTVSSELFVSCCQSLRVIN